MIYGIGLFVIAVACLAALWSPRVKDNLLECVGLSLVCMAATLQLWVLMFEEFSVDMAKLRWLMLAGVITGIAGLVMRFAKRKGA